MALAVLSAACSALAVREASCTDDAECEDAFGPGAICLESGACIAAGETDDEGSGGDTDGQCPDDLCPVALADACGGSDVPVLSSNDDFVLVDTSTLRNDYDELSCLEQQPVGNDGFFAFDASAGERWHFHIRVTDERANPSVYVLNTCDERTCQRGDALDLCGGGADEHVSFTADSAGRYFVGVDTRDAGGSSFELLAVQPTCGNGGMPEHSETCDDGNTLDLDGCDSSCRAEIRSIDPTEVEPNDDRVGANVLLLAPETASLRVQGTMGGRCDHDNFLVTVPESASVRATVLNAGGQPCGSDAPPAQLRLMSSDGVTVLGEGSLSGDNQCPSLPEDNDFATELDAGEYILRVFTGETEPSFDYSLEVEVVEEGA